MPIDALGSWEEFEPLIRGALDQPAGSIAPLPRGPEDPVRWGELEIIRVFCGTMEERFRSRGIAGAISFFKALIFLLVKRYDLDSGGDDLTVKGICQATRGEDVLDVSVGKKATRELAEVIDRMLGRYEQLLIGRLHALEIAGEAERKADRSP